MKQGKKISNAEYHASEGLSSSGIKELIKSPMHFRQYLETPKEQTPEMAKGSLVHAMILEPEIVDKEFAVGEFNIRRGKEYEKCAEENPGKTIVTRAEYEECINIAHAVSMQQKENPDLERLLKGEKEWSFYWEDQETGVQCKFRPDCLVSKHCISDIKTTRDASPDAFQKTVIDFGYHISAAFYLRGAKALGIAEKDAVFNLIAVETKAPYAVALYRLSPKAIEIADGLITQALHKYADAIATDEWQGYPKEILELDVPNWYLYKLNKR